MVILIGGIGCTGKTLMAQRMMEKYKVPYLSIDHLKMGLIKADMGCGFTAEDSTELIGEALWPILRGIITTNIENKQHIIIEGCYLLPHRIKELDLPYAEQTLAFHLLFSQKYLQSHFEDGLIKNRCVIEDRDAEMQSFVDFAQLHAALRAECEAQGAVYFEIQENYEQEMGEVYRWIDDEIQQRKLLAGRL